jgi:hypothetical protein
MKDVPVFEYNIVKTWGNGGKTPCILEMDGGDFMLEERTTRTIE